MRPYILRIVTSVSMSMSLSMIVLLSLSPYIDLAASLYTLLSLLSKWIACKTDLPVIHKTDSNSIVTLP